MKFLKEAREAQHEQYKAKKIDRFTDMIKEGYQAFLLAFIAEDASQEGVIDFDQFDNALLESPYLEKYNLKQEDLPKIFE